VDDAASPLTLPYLVQLTTAILESAPSRAEKDAESCAQFCQLVSACLQRVAAKNATKGRLVFSVLRCY
jgi:hypothetical protein